MTALEQFTMELVEAVAPDCDETLKQRLAIAVIQARAKEAAHLGTELLLKAGMNQLLVGVGRHLIDRGHKLEKLGLDWASTWPPDPKASAEAGDDSMMVQIN